MQWDKTQERIAKEIADNLQIPTSKGKEAIEIYMTHTAHKMRKLDHVTIPNIGRFFLSRWKTVDRLESIFGAFKKGTMTRDEVVEAVTKIWPIHRKAHEQYPATGKRDKEKLRKKDELRRANSDGK